jgi:mannose-1-phosphate guanylyltransferase
MVISIGSKGEVEKSDPSVVFAILAGGRGTRLWPLSTSTRPKQFLRLFGDKSLLRLTADRVSPLCSESSRLVVVTAAKHASIARDEAPGAAIIEEPSGRDTAGAYVLATAYALSSAKANGNEKALDDAVLVLLPADHLFAEEVCFRDYLAKAIDYAASNDSIVSLGVPAATAHAGYGYIQLGESISSDFFRVKSFCEKPTGEAAAELLCNVSNEPNLLWSAGIVIARASVLRRAFDQYLPPFGQAISRLLQAEARDNFEGEVADIFASLPSISFSASVQQLADNLIAMKMDEVGWLDVGSWDAWADAVSKDDRQNYSSGSSLLLHCERVAVCSDSRPVVVIGASDLIVVETDKAVLICSPEHAQEVKKAVDILAAKGLGNIL